MIGIVAHTARADAAHQLMESVGAAYMSVDDGTLGCDNNHRKAWQWMANNNPGEWSTIVEDDAKPIPNFRHHLHHALAAAGTDIVSLYRGHRVNNPPGEQHGLNATERADDANACWIHSHLLLHAVAVAIKTPLIDDMLKHIRTVALPIDEAITHWMRKTKPARTVAYTHPSLVDHADTDPVILRRRDKMPRPKGRTAYKTGVPTEWTDKAVTL
jgi:GR25 family glycosyltransferase involved in LPS biosynthesis